MNLIQRVLYRGSLARCKSTYFRTSSKLESSTKDDRYKSIFEKAYLENTRDTKRLEIERANMFKGLSKTERNFNDPHLLYISNIVKTSTKKLVPIARQIAHKTLDSAILQMHFSINKPATSVETTLIKARRAAIEKNLDKDSLFIDEAWVGKQTPKKFVFIKGRTKFAVHKHPRTKIYILIKDKNTIIRRESEKIAKLEKKLSAPILKNTELHNKSNFFLC